MAPFMFRRESFARWIRRIPGTRLGQTVLLLAGIAGAGREDADIVFPDSSYVVVQYACTFSGGPRAGEPLDILTVAPDGGGDTFAQQGISIRVFLRDAQGNPVVGVPAASITLRLVGGKACSCPGFNTADGPTDAAGTTSFSGALHASGCARNLVLVVDGVEICDVPVRTNSPIFTHFCHTTSSDIGIVAWSIQNGFYAECYDFNEDGTLDARDLAILTSFGWVECPTVPGAP